MNAIKKENNEIVNVTIPEHKQFCEVKFHRVCHRPEYLIKLGMEPTYDFFCEDDAVWYNAETQEFIWGDEVFCDLSEVIYCRPYDKYAVGGIVYKL